MTCSIALNKAMSVPGAIGRCRSASAAVSVRRGSTTMIFKDGFAARAASMRRYRTGCATAMFEPGDQNALREINVLVAGGRGVRAERRLVTRRRRGHAQPRIGVDVIGADEALGELVEDVIILG